MKKQRVAHSAAEPCGGASRLVSGSGAVRGVETAPAANATTPLPRQLTLPQGTLVTTPDSITVAHGVRELAPSRIGSCCSVVDITPLSPEDQVTLAAAVDRHESLEIALYRATSVLREAERRYYDASANPEVAPFRKARREVKLALAAVLRIRAAWQVAGHRVRAIAGTAR